MHAQAAVKGRFVLESGDEVSALTDDESYYLQAFNCQWLARSQPLAAQIKNFLVAVYKAGNMTAEELKVDPWLTVTQEVVNMKQQIDTVEHKAFIEVVTNITEKLFCSPEVEAKMIQANRKRKREAQLSTFNKLPYLALAKML